MIESPSDYNKKKNFKKSVKKNGQLKKEVQVSIAERSKYRKDFEKFVAMRKEKLKKFNIGVWVIFFLFIAFEMILKSQNKVLPSNIFGVLYLLYCLVFIPIYVLGHVALIEYSRGNVNWQIYLLGAPIFYVQYFFMTDEKTRIRYYIDHRKGKQIKTTF